MTETEPPGPMTPLLEALRERPDRQRGGFSRGGYESDRHWPSSDYLRLEGKKNMTTIDTITDEQIETLRTEAGAAGDASQADLCRVALGWTEHTDGARLEARERCVEAIREAELA